MNTKTFGKILHTCLYCTLLTSFKLPLVSNTLHIVTEFYILLYIIFYLLDLNIFCTMHSLLLTLALHKILIILYIIKFVIANLFLLN